MIYVGKERSRRVFDIHINKNVILRPGNLKERMSVLLRYLAHELVHVKQYLNGELFDYADGKRYRYKGVVYSTSTYETSDWDYYDSLIEIEAYGRTEGLYDMFYKQLSE